MSYILADCSKGGICRNLKNIINSMRMAEYYKCDLIIFWPKNIRVMNEDKNGINFINIKNIELNKILSFKKKYIIIDNGKLIKKYNIKKKIYSYKIDILPNEFKYNFTSELNKYLIKDDKQLAYEFNNIPLEIQENIIKHIDNIEINSDIIEKINLLFKNKKKIIGVTIRTYPEHKERRKYFNIDNYFNIIDKILNEYNYIFVCSDENEKIIKIKNRYGNKVIINQDLDNERTGSWNLSINDIIDLIALSKCDLLIGNLTSNYTEFIWFLTKCKIKYITVNEIPNNNIFKILEKGLLKKYDFIKLS